MRFGFPPPEGHKPRFYWGARAIYEAGYHARTGKWLKKDRCWQEKWIPPRFDMLPDRQTWDVPEGVQPGDTDLFRWINGAALPAAREWIKTQLSSSCEVFTFDDGQGFCLKASCNASYGYVYIGAWSHPAAEPVKEAMCENCGSASHHTDECIYSFGANPQ